MVEILPFHSKFNRRRLVFLGLTWTKLKHGEQKLKSFVVISAAACEEAVLNKTSSCFFGHMVALGKAHHFWFLKSTVVISVKAALIPCITKEENWNKLKLQLEEYGITSSGFWTYEESKQISLTKMSEVDFLLYAFPWQIFVASVLERVHFISDVFSWKKRHWGSSQ